MSKKLKTIYMFGEMPYFFSYNIWKWGTNRHLLLAVKNTTSILSQLYYLISTVLIILCMVYTYVYIMYV